MCANIRGLETTTALEQTNQRARKRFITDFLFDIEKGNCCTPISPAMQISIDSFGAVISNPASGLTLSAVQRMAKLPHEIVLAAHLPPPVFCHPQPTLAAINSLHPHE